MIPNVLLSLFIFVRCVFCAYYDPTPYELEGYLTSLPRSNWGEQARQQNSLRIVAIGGSNTANDVDKKGYVRLLGNYLKINVSLSSFVLNHGISGHSPFQFLGTQFSFEQHEASSWPNVVLLEFSINTVNRGDSTQFTALEYEKLVQFLKQKWRLKGLPYPDFILLELPIFEGLYRSPERFLTKDDKINYFNSMKVTDGAVGGLGFNRGCTVCAWINEYARFYSYPVISWREVSFFAFARHYIATANYSIVADRWPYSRDGVHMSPLACEYVVQNMLGPFFKKAIEPRIELPADQLHCTDDAAVCGLQFRMFAPQVVPNLFQQWTSWGFERANTLKDLVVPHPAWQWGQMRNHKEGHLAYCTTATDAPVTLLVPVSSNCTTALRCEIALSLIGSWNPDYIGDTACTVREKSNQAFAPQSRNITGQWTDDGQRTHISGPFVRTVAQHLVSGMYEVQCTNLVASRATCITDADVRGFIVV